LEIVRTVRFDVKIGVRNANGPWDYRIARWPDIIDRPLQRRSVNGRDRNEKIAYPFPWVQPLHVVHSRLASGDATTPFFPVKSISICDRSTTLALRSSLCPEQVIRRLLFLPVLVRSGGFHFQSCRYALRYEFHCVFCVGRDVIKRRRYPVQQ